MALIFKCLSALEKCFMDESIESKTEYTSASVLRGEEFARTDGGSVDIGCYQCWLPVIGMKVSIR